MSTCPKNPKQATIELRTRRSSFPLKALRDFHTLAPVLPFHILLGAFLLLHEDTYIGLRFVHRDLRTGAGRVEHDRRQVWSRRVGYGEAEPHLSDFAPRGWLAGAAFTAFAKGAPWQRGMFDWGTQALTFVADETGRRFESRNRAPESVERLPPALRSAESC